MYINCSSEIHIEEEPVIMKEKVILAYSGGLDTTAMIPWLKDNFDYEAAASTVDREMSWKVWMSVQSFPGLPNYTSKTSRMSSAMISLCRA